MRVCFVFFLFFGGGVKLFICVFVCLFFFFFFIKKNEFKNFDFHIGDGSSINKWNNLLAQILQKNVAMCPLVIIRGVNESSRLGFGVNPPLDPITSGFELLDLSLIADSIKTNRENFVNHTIGSIEILSNTMGCQRYDKSILDLARSSSDLQNSMA